ncbi:tRNA (cytidine(34)-2'-O)-methyltransferase [Spongiimicrobium salis]|uniref:tRNA (cytidine(34)-2'-O)-methyltransferase n=1 Tax=Spongiimicrobium salis TaxID=1667022 RepID=UPI00374C9D1B
MKACNFNIVLVTPEIPNNTGNIGRLCVGSHSTLHLVRPLGFEITDSRVKRAGLDYWGDLQLHYHDSFEALMAQIHDISRIFLFTAKAQTTYYEQNYQKGDWLIFGKESKGLPVELLEQFKQQCVKIPFPGPIRSFNLGNAVAMALGEGLRQLEGNL